MTEIYDPVEPGKDYIVQVRVKNGPMLRAMRRKGWTAAELSRRTGVSQQKIGQFLSLKHAPINRQGAWTRNILAIAKGLGVLPEDLFPPQHLEAALKRSSGEFEVSQDDLVRMLAAPSAPSPETLLLRAGALSRLRESLADLTPQQERILRLRFGLDGSPEMTLEAIGDQIGSSKEHVRRIEAWALKKLRHPARSIRRGDIDDLTGEDTA